MHVALDVTPLESGHKLRGIGSYTKQLIEALKKHKSNHLFTFFTRGQSIPKNADLVHYPYFDPFFITLPFIKPKPTVVTVHDLIPIAFSNHFPRGLRGEIKWRIQRLSLKNVRAIITDSLSSKDDIALFTGFPQGKIYVVRLAPAKVFDKKKPRLLKDPYVLYVGDVNWNKNISGLLRAFAVMKQKQNIDLVLAGMQFLNRELPETAAINDLIKKLSLEGSVKKLGYVSDEELAGLYENAQMYVQPSFAEGFGFPVLEAMASGCPVVCSNISSLVEISGPSILVNPYKHDDIARGMNTLLLFTRDQRERMVHEGFRWVKHFSWQKVAKETIGVYENVVA